MKPLWPALLALALPFTSWSQNNEAEFARRAAELVQSSLSELKDLQIQVDPDLEKPHLIRRDDTGVMAIPAKRLAADTLKQLGEALLPVGQLWMGGVRPVKEKQVVAEEKLRVLPVETDSGTIDLPFFLLGIRKKGEGAELVVFGKEKEPLLVLPLEKATGTQEMPIELEAEPSGGDSGVVRLRIAGTYQARLPLARGP